MLLAAFASVALNMNPRLKAAMTAVNRPIRKNARDLMISLHIAHLK